MTDDDRGPRAEDSTDRLIEVFNLVGPLYRKAQRKVEEDAPAEGLSVGVRAVLNILREHEPQTVPQMGRAQALSRQFVQRMINEAADRGMVEFAPNPAHKRSSLIRLTDRGRAAITAVIDRERVLLSQAAEGLTDEEIDTCLRVLSQLLRYLDPVDVNRVLPDPVAPPPAGSSRPPAGSAGSSTTPPRPSAGRRRD